MAMKRSEESRAQGVCVHRRITYAIDSAIGAGRVLITLDSRPGSMIFNRFRGGTMQLEAIACRGEGSLWASRDQTSASDRPVLRFVHQCSKSYCLYELATAFRKAVAIHLFFVGQGVRQPKVIVRSEVFRPKVCFICGVWRVAPKHADPPTSQGLVDYGMFFSSPMLQA
jgi:hypothetical protein